MIQKIILTFSLFSVLAGTPTLVKYKSLKVIQEFQKIGANSEDAAVLAVRSFNLSGVATKKIHASYDKIANRTNGNLYLIKLALRKRGVL